MKRIHYKRILNFLLIKWQWVFFFASGLLLLSFFPRGGKFKYEYQKGKPWMHEVLIAPFDFSIYKTQAELAHERDSILRYFPPYFNYIPKIGRENRVLASSYLKKQWNTYQLSHNTQDSNWNFVQKMVEQKVIEILEIIYKNGILEIPEESSVYSRLARSIYIIKDNIAEEYDIEQIFTIKKAYEFFRYELEKLNDHIRFVYGYDLDSFFRALKIEQFLTPNLFFDEQTTIKNRQAVLDNISLTEGMIMAGERIIFTGDIVNHHTYKILQSLQQEYESRLAFSGRYLYVWLGQLVLVVFCMLLIYFYLKKNYQRILYSISHLGFILFIMLFFAFIASMMIKFRPSALYMIPFAVMAILLKTFLDARIAHFIYLITILLIGFWAPNSFEFIFINLTAGMVALLSLTNMYRRNKMFMTALWVTFAYFSIYIGTTLYQMGSLNQLNLDNIFYLSWNALLILSTLPLIYLFEKIFGFISDATLLELSDTNQPLLRSLAEIAPGTFQHSLQVANLAEEAIYRIGGNPLLIRTGALYHDIGKMDNPSYFIENLSDKDNPHNGLLYEESAKIIIGHIHKGVEKAHEYHLPEQVIDFIRTHHGTTKAYYFYRSYIKLNPESEIDAELFTYPGPKPFSREMAVLMIADSIEAASRSLKKYTEKEINNLVDSIIDNLLKERQFDETNLTLKDIDIIRTTFKNKLINIYHVRIEYPLNT